MNERPEATDHRMPLDVTVDHFWNYVGNLPLDEIFEEGEIAGRTEEIGTKGPKMFVREILHGVKGIDRGSFELRQRRRKGLPSGANGN